MRSVLIVSSLLLVAGCAHRPELDMLGFEPDTEAVGVIHEVEAGQSLAAICRAYGVDIQDVVEINGIEQPNHLAIGQKIFIPDADAVLTIDDSPSSRVGADALTDPAPSIGRFIWPLDGVITSKYGVRNGRRHDGIDIAAPADTPFVATADGKVLYAGEQRGYGKLIIIRHADNFISIYAHNTENSVKENEDVLQGQMIGKVGMTGRATGPHLHFEIRSGTRPRNPLFLLPRPK